MASSGDFGATYGSGSGCYNAPGAAEHFVYLRVWRCNRAGAWRILAEVVNVREPE